MNRNLYNINILGIGFMFVFSAFITAGFIAAIVLKDFDSNGIDSKTGAHFTWWLSLSLSWSQHLILHGAKCTFIGALVIFFCLFRRLKIVVHEVYTDLALYNWTTNSAHWNYTAPRFLQLVNHLRVSGSSELVLPSYCKETRFVLAFSNSKFNIK